MWVDNRQGRNSRLMAGLTILPVLYSNAGHYAHTPAIAGHAALQNENLGCLCMCGLLQAARVIHLQDIASPWRLPRPQWAAAS